MRILGIVFVICAVLALLFRWLMYHALPFICHTEKCPRTGCVCTSYKERGDGYVECDYCQLVYNPTTGKPHPMEKMAKLEKDHYPGVA